MPEAAKSPAQIQVEALNRKRKPLIKFDDKTVEELKKAHAAEIENLSRQLSGLQTDIQAKEAFIKELEDKIEKLQKPADTGPPIVKTEEVPGQAGTRRQRQAAAAPKPKDEEKPKDEPQQTTTTDAPTTTAPAKIVKPGDGIEEDD